MPGPKYSAETKEQFFGLPVTPCTPARRISISTAL
jgi:hypothetical protein